MSHVAMNSQMLHLYNAFIWNGIGIKYLYTQLDNNFNKNEKLNIATSTKVTANLMDDVIKIRGSIDV